MIMSTGRIIDSELVKQVMKMNGMVVKKVGGMTIAALNQIRFLVSILLLLHPRQECTLT